MKTYEGVLCADLNRLFPSHTVRPDRSVSLPPQHSWCHRVTVYFEIRREEDTRVQTSDGKAAAVKLNLPHRDEPALFLSTSVAFLCRQIDFFRTGGGAKRLREGCLKDIDGNNPFTPSAEARSRGQDPQRGWSLQQSSQSSTYPLRDEHV